jgi:Ca-activated chloride channel family protein
MRAFWQAGLWVLALAAGGFAPAQARAENPATIIVMDGSGSMWGQIGGRPKLEIARETVAGVLDTLPEGQQLGLMAYGHREKGNCSDIELMVPPAPGTADQIRAAVNTMRFLGKTPLSEAVRQAAEALRYGEEAATVVLVTDGLETCAADPCALGRELEAAGLNFTAHVIGFGLSEAEGAQVACLAESTGGRYFAAGDAAALAGALQATVAAEVPPPPAPSARRYFPGAPEMPDVALAPTGETTGAGRGNPPEFSFPADGTSAQCAALCAAEASCDAWRYEPPGSYFVAEARCFGFGASSEMDYDTYPPGEGWASGIRDGVLMLVRPYVADEPLPEAALEAPGSAPAGQSVSVGWSGPAAELDSIEIGLPGDGERWTWVYVATGNPVSLLMPGEPGSYELRYRFRDHSVIATRPIEVTGAPVTLTAPGQVPAGNAFSVRWTGPDAPQDNIQIALPGDDGYLSYAYVGGTNPVTLTAPDAPGLYELRYKLADTEVIATRPLEVLPAGAALPGDPPAAGPAGPVPVVIEADAGGTNPSVVWSAVPVPGQDLPPEAWAMPEGIAGPVTAEFLPGLYDVTGEAGDQVFAGRIEVTADGDNRFVIPYSAALSPAGEDHGAAGPVPLRIRGVYDGVFATWAAVPLGSQDSLTLESGAARPGAWETQLDPGPWLIRGRHEGATGATYLAVLQVSAGMAPDVTIARPRYGATEGDGNPFWRICDGDLPCFLRDGDSGLQLGLPPGWGMEQPLALTTAAGVSGPGVHAVFRPQGDARDAVMVALNPRQWDAMLGPCDETAIGPLCRTGAMGAEDLQAYHMLRATLEQDAAQEQEAAPSVPPGAAGGLPERIGGIRLDLPEGLDLLETLAPQLVPEEAAR